MVRLARDLLLCFGLSPSCCAVRAVLTWREHLHPAEDLAPRMPWETPPPQLVLERDHVHVWRAWLDHEPGCGDSFRATLSPDERARADRFRFDRDRARFVAGRAALRMILGRYLRREPAALRFGYGPQGKPFLADAPGADLRFNLSHSYGLALYAVARGRDVGIDVEKIDPRLENGIAEQFFSPREVAALRSLPSAGQTEAFFACWTRKEAYAKARGEGLRLRLDQFEVSLGESAALLRSDEDPGDTRRWRLEALSPGSGYAAAIAVGGDCCSLACWQWSWPCRCLTAGSAGGA